MPRAYVVAGPLVGRSLELFDGATLGRGEDSDLVLPEASVSRRHAVLERDGERWVLVDAGSRNGLRVGERRVERRVLVDGDEVALGKVVLRFRVEDTDAAPHSALRPHARAERRTPARPSASDEATLPLATSSQRDLHARVPAASSPASSSPESLPADLRTERRAELLAELEAEGGGFFSGDLAQRPAWVRWSLYLLALAVAAAACAGAFRLVWLLRQA